MSEQHDADLWSEPARTTHEQQQDLNAEAAMVSYYVPDVGRYEGLNDGVYHAEWNAVNASKLKQIKDLTPAHVKYEIEHPSTKKPTDALTLGSAIHCSLLEPDRFDGLYVIEPQQPRDNDAKTWRATKLFKEAKAEQVANGCVPLQIEDFEACHLIRDKLLNTPSDARDLIMATTATEVSFAEVDPITGLMCKIRTDGLAPGICWDLKKCESMWRFDLQLYQLGYYISAAFYLEVLEWHRHRMAFDKGAFLPSDRIESYMFIAVEDHAPFEFRLVELDAQAMDKGARDYRKLLDRWHKCVESAEWPGYNRKLETVSLPGYAYTQEDESL